MSTSTRWDRPGLPSTDPSELSRPLDVATASAAPRTWRWLVAALAVLVVVWLGQGMATNENFAWPVVGEYLFAPVILDGLRTSLVLTVICMLLAIVIGIVVASARRSDIAFVRWAGAGYVWLFRGLPPLVQLIFWFNLAALTPTISIGIPWGPSFVGWGTNELVTPMLAAVLGLSLNEGAYMAEIIRAGLLSVDPGQAEAAKALSMSGSRTFWRITMPQAMKFVVPPTGTQVINMVRATSLVSVIALGDLLYSAQLVYHRTFQTIPLLVVACIWYLVVTSVLYRGQTVLERRFSRGSRTGRPAAPRRRALASVKESA